MRACANTMLAAARQGAGGIAEAAFEAIVVHMEMGDAGAGGSASPRASAEMDEVAYTPSAFLDGDDALGHSMVSTVR